MTLISFASRVILLGTLFMLLTVANSLGKSKGEMLSNEVIAFVSDQDGNYDIYTITPGGSATNLTHNEASDMFPAWSPDGQYIAFISNRDNEEGDVFVMKADGSDIRNLTNNDALDQGRPAWSPDGQYIVFISNRDNEEGDVFVVSVGDGTIKNLTNDSARDFSPSWSADGRNIVFVSDKQNASGVFLINWQNLDIQSVIAPLKDVVFWYPYFSPTANQIAFTSVDGNLYISDTKGDKQHINTDDKFMPPVSWSPDGMWLTGSLGNRNGTHIVLIRRDDLTFQTIPHDGFNDWSPTWSPDGQYIATLSSRNGIGDIFVFSVDDKEIHKVTDNVLKISSETPLELLLGQLDWKPKLD